MSEEAQKSTLKTSKGGHIVEMADMISAGLGRRVALLQQRSGSADDDEAVHNAMILASVKSIDGSSEGILDKVLAMDIMDYVQVIQAATEMFGGLPEEKKSE